VGKAATAGGAQKISNAGTRHIVCALLAVINEAECGFDADGLGVAFGVKAKG
jgi:hypothetical protein